MSAAHSMDERRVMNERAQRLARRKSHQEQRQVTAEIIVVGVGRQRFGLPVNGVAEIVRRPPLTPLPGLPDHLPGLAVVRGQLFCTVDLGHWLGATRAPGAAAGYLVLLEAQGGRPLGLLVSRVEGLREVYADEVAEHLARDRAEERRPVSFTTRDLVAVLDLAQLIEHPDIARTAEGVSR